MLRIMTNILTISKKAIRKLMLKKKTLNVEHNK